MPKMFIAKNYHILCTWVIYDPESIKELKRFPVISSNLISYYFKTHKFIAPETNEKLNHKE